MVLLFIFTLIYYYLITGLIISTVGLLVVLALDIQGFTYKDFIAFTVFWLYALVSILIKE